MTKEQQPRSHFLAHPLGRRLLGEGEDGGDGDKLAMAWTMIVALMGMDGPLFTRFWILGPSTGCFYRIRYSLLALKWAVRNGRFQAGK